MDKRPHAIPDIHRTYRTLLRVVSGPSARGQWTDWTFVRFVRFVRLAITGARGRRIQIQNESNYVND
jgi:hypothetical protein